MLNRDNNHIFFNALKSWNPDVFLKFCIWITILFIIFADYERYEIKKIQAAKKSGEYNIKKAMKEIPEEDYLAVAEKLITTKWNTLKNEQYINRTVKTTAFLQQRGFEPSLVQSILKKIRSTE
jgi:SOS response regulatory protein OraA/RecX